MIDTTALDGKIRELLDRLYQKRFGALSALRLEDLMKKNPYLYRSIGLDDAAQLIEQVLIARVSSSDETIFGNDFFEPLALWAAQEASSADPNRVVTVGAGAGQDVSIEDLTQYMAISVKSGTNILNAQSSKGQNQEFIALQKRLQKLGKQFRPIMGYGYGRSASKAASATEKVAGQKFWHTLTDEKDFYLRIGRSIGKYSGQHGEEYARAFAAKKNLLTAQFILNFVDTSTGQINWDKIVAFSSAEARPSRLNQLPAEPQEADASPDDEAQQA